MNPLPSWVTRIRDEHMREAAMTARIKLLARAEELPAEHLTTKEANAVLAVIADAHRDLGSKESLARRWRTQLDAVCGEVSLLKDHMDQVRGRLLEVARYSKFTLSSDTETLIDAAALRKAHGDE